MRQCKILGIDTDDRRILRFGPKQDTYKSLGSKDRTTAVKVGNETAYIEVSGKMANRPNAGDIIKIDFANKTITVVEEAQSDVTN